jgi:hypothetical protein
MKSLIVTLCLVCLFAPLRDACFAQSPTMPQTAPLPEYSLTGLGVYGGVDYRPMTMDARGFAGVPTCCPQKYGTQTTLNWLAGIAFDHTLTNWLLLDVRAHLFSTKADFRQVEKILVGIGGTGVDVSINHTLNVSMMNLGIEPSLKMRLLPLPITTTFAPSLYLQVGVNTSLVMADNYQYEESLAPDSPARYVGINRQTSTTRNQQNGRIPLLNQLQFAVFAGLDSEIYLQQLFPANWILAPFARYYVPLTSLTEQKELFWGNAIQGGIALRYRFITPKN